MAAVLATEIRQDHFEVAAKLPEDLTTGAAGRCGCVCVSDHGHATKFAVEGFSDSLRLEVKPFGIKVVIIQPGLTESEWVTTAMANSRPGKLSARSSTAADEPDNSPTRRR